MTVEEIAGGRRSRSVAKAPRSGRRTGHARDRGAARRRPPVSPSYLELMRAYPVRPIRSERELDRAIAVVDSLLSRENPLDRDGQDYLDILSHEIERYEAVAYPMPAVSGADMLRYLMDAHENTLSEVSEGTGIAVSTLSAILNNKRGLNIAHIGLLAPYFGVEQGVFLD
jgi:HTH-type transcriptional regulator/antitoxin HigA